MISVLINGDVREVPEAVELDRLLELFSFPKQRIAIEVNNNVVRRVDWPEKVISEGDKIEIVHFVGGG